MNKLLLTSGILVLPLTSGQVQKQGSPSKTPNVVFIMADDLRIGDLGRYGRNRIKAPAIDALAAQGMKFTQHCPGPTVNAPSRCVFLIGKHIGHFYIRGNGGYKAGDGRSYNLNLVDEEVTIGEIFKTKNYAAACVGKQGLGDPSAEGHPNKRGFDYFFGHPGQGNAHNYHPIQLLENNIPIILNRRVCSHDMVMDEALESTDKNTDKPFFVCLASTIPHADIIVPNNKLFDYDGKFEGVLYPGRGYHPRERPRATLAAMVARLDRNMRRIIDLLADGGVLDNTIIIFTSDSGAREEGEYDPRYLDSNGPFQRIKRDLYEGGMRTSFIIKQLGVIPVGSASFQISTLWDFMLTMYELIGAPAPANANGLSYLSTLTGRGKQKQHDYLYSEFHEQGNKQAAIENGWRLLYLQVNNPQKEHCGLHNLNTDPGENANVLNQYPQKVQELKRIMKKVRTTSENWRFVFEK